MLYLIPKNIKVKHEIFKGFGIIEIIAVGLSLGTGFLLQYLVSGFYLKMICFISLPLLTFLLLLPLPNGSTPLVIFKKFIKYKRNQKTIFLNRLKNDIIKSINRKMNSNL